jgi:ribosome-binding protein aMBF1 (putative translation factor)
VKAKSAKRLAKAGWKLGDAKDFLKLDASEAEFMEIKLGLARRLRELRAQHSWTQADLAARLGSSQSRVAKMEAADSTVSVDLLVRSLLTAERKVPMSVCLAIETSAASTLSLST